MKPILTIITALVSLFFSTAPQAAEPTMPSGDFSEMKRTGTSRVTEIVNPLTIKLEDGRIIHLAGLDFPDLNYYEPGDLAVTASQILEDFLKNKKVIIYQTPSSQKGRMNRMGHNIAHLVRLDNNVWTQGLLLSLGVARTRTTQYNPEMAEQMLALEEKSRKEKSGLWGMNKFQVLTPEQAEKHIGSYQIVEGTIQSASMKKNRLYLNFGNNWKDDFTASVSALNLRKFIKQKIEPRKWNGKRIRVRGWIESYNGPYMEIDHPQRFEALFEKEKITPPQEVIPKSSLSKENPFLND